MKIDIRARDFPLTPDLETLIQDEVRNTMNSYSHRISVVKVRLKVIHQSKGILDTQCCVEVRVKRLQTVVAIKRSYDAETTIRQCIAQAGWSTVRLLENQQFERYQNNIGRLSLPRHKLLTMPA